MATFSSHLFPNLYDEMEQATRFRLWLFTYFFNFFTYVKWVIVIIDQIDEAFSKAQITGTQFASGDHSALEHKTPREGLT